MIEASAVYLGWHAAWVLADGLLAAGLARVATRGGRRLGVVRLAALGVVMGAFVLGRTAASAFLGLVDWFGAVAMVYAAAVASAALVGAAVAVWGRPTRVVRWICVVGAASAAGMGVWASAVEPRWVEVTRTEVLPAATGAAWDRPVRVAVLADIQTTSADRAYWEGVVERVRAAAPDLIVLPGDLGHAPGKLGGVSSLDHARWAERASPGFRRLFERLDAIAPGRVFYSPGNVDRGGRNAVLLENTPARVLDDAWAEVDLGGGRAVLVGGLSWPHGTPDARAFLERFARASARTRATGGRSLLLAHVPDAATLLDPGAPIDLVVSGHTHGGQVRLPGLGPITAPTRLPRRVAGGGLHEVGGVRLYVSRGLGYERGQAPPLRIFCRPELAILDLY